MFDEIIAAYKKFWINYVNFDDRTNRKDFWYTILANFIISGVLSILNSSLNVSLFGTLSSLYSLAVLIPNIAIEVRRLHDINKSGWTLLMGLIPIAGIIILICDYCKDSVKENNNYGVEI